MLSSRLGSFSGLQVLDLFAGSGALALETLSRGAESAVLVDSGRQAARTIEDNIARCHFQSQTTFIGRDVATALSGLKGDNSFDLIFLDPPYGQQLIPPTLRTIADLQLLSERGIICVDSAKDEKYNDFGSLILLTSRTFGSTRIHLYCLSED
jgi:16S rRNA (guanine(966)-N(2))-methyltransferase RsmD